MKRLLLSLAALAAFTPSAFAMTAADYEARLDNLAHRWYQDANPIKDRLRVIHTNQDDKKFHVDNFNANVREVNRYAVCVMEPSKCHSALVLK